MKKRIYLRVAKCKTGLSVRAENSPNYHPIKFKVFHPTVLIALDLDIPDKEFDAARILLEAKIQETEPAVEIKQIVEEHKPENGTDDQGSEETDQE